MTENKNRLPGPAVDLDHQKNNWISVFKNGLVIRLWVQPKASKTEIVKLYGEPPRLKIKIAAPPVDGKANEEIIRFFSAELVLSKTHFEILRGESSRAKDLFIFCEATRQISGYRSHLLSLCL